MSQCLNVPSLLYADVYICHIRHIYAAKPDVTCTLLSLLLHVYTVEFVCSIHGCCMLSRDTRILICTVQLYMYVCEFAA